MQEHNRFKRHQKPTFICTVCKRRTRHTGQDVDHLCADCFELAGLDNQCNDDGVTPAQIGPGAVAEIARRVAHIKKLGGDVAAVRSANRFLFATKVLKVLHSPTNYLTERDKLRAKYARLADLHYQVEFVGKIDKASELCEALGVLAGQIEEINR